MLEHYKDLSPYLRRCNKLTLSPDFLIPQEIGEEETQSTIVDSEERMSWSSGSSGSENNMRVGCNQNQMIVRKKRSSSNYKVVGNFDNEDMATSMISRRKGIPHRSPLC